jgi:hypothetical protein
MSPAGIDVSGPGTRSRSKERSLFRAVGGKEKSMNRVAVVAITSISLWVGSLVDQEKLEYLIAGALFTLAMELVVRIITVIARKVTRPKVHSV